MKSGVRVGGFWLRVAFDALSRSGFDADAYWKQRKLEPPRGEIDAASFPYEETTRLWRTAALETGNPHLGLHAAESLPVQMPNIFSYVFLAAPNLRDAMLVMTRFQQVVMNARVSSFEDRGDHFLWTAQLPLAPPASPQQFEYIVAILMRLCFFVGGETFKPLAVNFRHPMQGDPKEYERFFKCPVAFLKPQNSILFDRDSMLKPNPLSNPQTLKMLISAAENVLAQRNAESWTARVSAALQPTLATGAGTLDGIARSMNVSARTLQRTLATEHTTFQSVLDATRRHRAMELMTQAEMPLARVAKETGFADPRAFNRAFQRWTGQNPSTYRQGIIAQANRGAAPRLRVVGK